MNYKIKKILNNEGKNYVIPFFWQHGEDEATLRKYMKVIEESNIKAVCVESRPHPDFCGPKWWQDMDVIFDEARKRNMKVWILDDSHFPTGYANGAMKKQPPEMQRQNICCRSYRCGGETFQLSKEAVLHPEVFQPTEIEAIIAQMQGDNRDEKRQYDDDRLLGIYGVRIDTDKEGFVQRDYCVNLKEYLCNDELKWDVPEGNWNVYVLHLTRNRGGHSDYINMLDKASCRVLIDAVYEPHWEHYCEDFGETLAGFFSDEPELGNGHLYEQGNILGYSSSADYPWSMELEDNLKNALGEDFALYLSLLWENNADPDITAKVRYTYMDYVTKLVEKNFSYQVGNWCREHGVQYIGHVIEDNNQHARTGSSLGHYFRGLAGQNMAGIDDIGGQVFPQGEDAEIKDDFEERNGEFYHYMLGKLASSAAAIEPLKKGKAMCEIFGNYGWEEGVRLEKYLTDHFLVRGINHFVPHAFSPKEFPDPDCPPHFYAHGHNPQYRHFGALMAYTNRVCELISNGKHIAPIAVLYHGEGEWSGSCMFSHKVGHILADAQIEYDYIPQDVFVETDAYQTHMEDRVLKVNTQEYKVVIIPAMQYITAKFAESILAMKNHGIPVVFVDKLPEGLCDSDKKEVINEIRNCQVLQLTEIEDYVRTAGAVELYISPSNGRIRYYQYKHKNASTIYLLVNEGESCYEGIIYTKEKQSAYHYDAWENKIYFAEGSKGGVKVRIEPLKSLILVYDDGLADQIEVNQKIERRENTSEVPFTGKWGRQICQSIHYPEFEDKIEVVIPDNLAEVQPEFSGFVRYSNTFRVSKESSVFLEIEDAHEGVEVFINGKSVGIQIVPPFVYDISNTVKKGENQLIVEVATTLERQMATVPDMFNQMKEPTSLSGITGAVRLHC